MPALPVGGAVTTAADIAAAEAELSRQDPVLAHLVEVAGPCTIRSSRRAGRVGHFEELARSIVYQQLAGRAAAAIWDRVRALVDGPFTPEAVLALDEPTLRSAGLSGAKARSIADLALKVADGQVALARVGRLADDLVVAELVQVKGIGPWTAQMFLMFQLGRLDVWPTGDFGVRKGYGVAWGLPEAPSPVELEALGDRFRPYRSVVAWYCWRAVETVTPEAV